MRIIIDLYTPPHDTAPPIRHGTSLIGYVDLWVSRLEQEDYSGALAMVDYPAGWTPDLLRDIIKVYGEESPTQRVTLAAAPTDVHQRKEVDRWDDAPNGSLGEVWYDLGINGLKSDLTATFTLREPAGSLVLILNDVHVM